MAQERPDLEEEKNKLVVQNAENSAKLQEVEDQILRVLSSSEGNILEDGEAVAILQESKRVSDDIGEKQKVAKKTEVSIDEARVNYDPVAKHASVLFFTVVEIGNIDPMYQYSLTYFIGLFLRSIKDSPKEKVSASNCVETWCRLFVFRFPFLPGSQTELHDEHRFLGFGILRVLGFLGPCPTVLDTDMDNDPRVAGTIAGLGCGEAPCGSQRPLHLLPLHKRLPIAV